MLGAVDILKVVVPDAQNETDRNKQLMPLMTQHQRRFYAYIRTLNKPAQSDVQVAEVIGIEAAEKGKVTR